MVNLCDNKTSQYLGVITQDPLRFFSDNLKDESLSDADYHIKRGMCHLLKEEDNRRDSARLIEDAMGGNNRIEMAYERI